MRRNEMEILNEAKYEFDVCAVCGCHVFDDDGICHDTDQDE